MSSLVFSVWEGYRVGKSVSGFFLTVELVAWIAGVLGAADLMSEVPFTHTWVVWGAA